MSGHRISQKECSFGIAKDAPAPRGCQERMFVLYFGMPKVSEAHRAARRGQILDAAIRCVGREGFHRTTMNHVIAESGLSAGAVYGYFKGKPDLIKAIAARAQGGLADLLGEVATGPGPVSPGSALRAVLLEVERLSKQSDGAFSKVVMHAWSEAAREVEVLEVVSANADRLRYAWIDVLRRAEADGNLPGAGDLDSMARVMLGVLPGFVLQSVLVGDVDAESYVSGFESFMNQQLPASRPGRP